MHRFQYGPTCGNIVSGRRQARTDRNGMEQEIRSGALGFGDRVQSENELVQRFSVSRNTVRRGLEELWSRVLMTTRIGIGSFVTFDGKMVDDAIGPSKALADAGANAETRTLRLEVIEDAGLAAGLGIDNPGFIAVDRVRSNAGDGSHLDRAQPLAFIGGIGRGSAQGPAGRFVAPDVARRRAYTRSWRGMGRHRDAIGRRRGHSGLRAGDDVLRTRRLSRSGDGRPIEDVAACSTRRISRFIWSSRPCPGVASQKTGHWPR